MRALHVEKGLLRRLYGNMKGNKENHKLLQLLLAIFIFRGKPFQPLFPMHFTPQKKREGNCLVYFRFLIIAKLARPKTAAIETAPIIAASVLINGAGVSGVIGPEDETAGPTATYAIA